MPDEPEPELHFTELPIWHAHPDKTCFKRFPFSKFEEQMDMMYRSSDHKMAKANPKYKMMYECFVCGQKHDAAEVFRAEKD